MFSPRDGGALGNTWKAQTMHLSDGTSDPVYVISIPGHPGKAPQVHLQVRSQGVHGGVGRPAPPGATGSRFPPAPAPGAPAAPAQGPAPLQSVRLGEGTITHSYLMRGLTRCAVL